jgi:protein-tyrosine phosphatase
MLVHVWDMPSANLRSHFDACHSFINEAISGGGKVLIHCFAGVSRSSTITISYLMKQHGMSFTEAYKLV